MIIIKKIIIISWKEVDYSVLRKNYVNSLREQYKIFILDISSILHFGTINTKKKIKSLKNLSIIKATSLKILLQKIKKINPDMIIPYFIENYSIETKKIFKRLIELNVPLMKIRDTKHINKFAYYKSKFIQKFFHKKMNYQYIIEVASRNFQHLYKSENKIYIHHYDYEKYLTIKSKLKRNTIKRNTIKKNAVFIDENLIYHPDITRNKKINWDNPDNYFIQMNKFFGFIEKNFNMDIKIAAHPSTYQKHYGKYKNYINKTAELVSKADLVLIHQSTALSFAVLFKKKILFLTSKEIEKKIVLNKSIVNTANFFKSKPIYIDNKLVKSNLENNMVTNSIRYKLFKDYFLKHPKGHNKKFIQNFKKYFANK